MIQTDQAQRALDNKRTLIYRDEVADIPAPELFVTEAGRGHRLEELPALVIRNPEPFSPKDLQVLATAIPAVRQALTDFVNDNVLLRTISDATLRALSQLSRDLKGSINNSVAENDVRRSEAMVRFYTYYGELGDVERDALNNAPCLDDAYMMYALHDRLEGIFKLRADACAGGTSGIINEIRRAVTLYRAAYALLSTPRDGSPQP